MAAAIAYSVRAPEWLLTYAGVDISADVSPMVREITYVDRLSSASGEVEIEIEDHAKLWQGPWYPALGDQVSLSIGYRDEGLLPCGDFQVDDLELAGPPDVLHLRCLAAYITPPMRTANSVGYENVSIVGIAEIIAAKYGFALIAASDLEELQFARVTQSREADLEFLKRLANEHDYDFTLRGAQLVFYARGALEAAAPIATIVRSDVERFSFRNRTRRIYSRAEVFYQNPETKELIAQSVSAELPPATGDALKIVTRCENGQQAAIKAQGALHLHNMIYTEARLEAPGSVLFSAGNNLALSGWGVLDGTYLIETARHRLSRARGYTTELEVRSG